MAETAPSNPSDLERMRALQQARRGAPVPPSAQPRQPETDQAERNPAAELARGRVQARREAAEREQTQEGTESATAAARGTVADKGKVATAHALQKSWLGLIPSWGLTAIYLNLHFVAKYILGLRIFCDFGEEWILTTPMGQQLAAQGRSKVGAAKYGEFILLFFIDILIALVLAAAIALISVLVYAVRHWWNIATLLLSK